MTQLLLKKYPKKVDTQKRREYTLQFGQEAYIKKEPKIAIDMRKIEANSGVMKYGV